MNTNAKPVLVIGGGIAGITAAVEAAEVGYRVILVEKEPYIGGRVVRTHQYFPKMCPPTCGYEINIRRIKQNPAITVHTMSSVEDLTGIPGNFKAKIRKRPRYVTGTHTIDESVMEKVSAERNDEFNLGMNKTRALYMPHDMAYPFVPVLDREALSDDDALTLVENLPAGAVDLKMEDEEFVVGVGAVIVATGWRPYDAKNLEHLGFGRCANVVTNVMMERLAARRGPTGGEIVRPSDAVKPKNVAFVQCAGSRDVNHLPYCSAVCCMAALKQTRYIREKIEDARVTVFYIDIRTVGREEDFYYDLLEDENVSFVKGKVSTVEEEAGTGNLILNVEDTITGENLHANFDMVVLSAGIVPNTAELVFPVDVGYDEYGFIDGTTSANGIFAAGCARHPCDVSRTTKDATAAALKAIQVLNRGE
jgi:quinone-modifying oxidoreductase subunit QmoA